ncbi:MAG: hypothetical protein IJ833_04405 [Lachnospiraceae bacterium]|nr:hypothetical protein [Lachnospiraceae bacterium]
MEQRLKGLQEETVGLQEQLGLLVEQTSRLFADIHSSAAKGSEENRVVQSMPFLAAQLGLRQKQYQELSQRTERVSAEVATLSKEKGTADAAVTLNLLRQMAAQIAMEEKQLQGLQEELEVWKQASDTDTAVQSMSLLEKLKKGLTESKL